MVGSPSPDQIYQWGGRRRNTKEVPRMEKQSYSWITIFFANCKVSGRNYCRLFRSSYLKIVKERFLLLPITITCSTISGLTWVKQDVDTHCLSSSQNFSFKTQLGVTALKRFPKGIPYGYSCPSVQDVIKVCASYLVSIKKMLSRK